MPTYDSIAAFAKVQIKNIQDALKAEYVLRAAVVPLVPEIKDRIQQRGQKADNSQIGTYGNRVIPQAFGKAQSFASKKRLKTLKGTDSYKEVRQKLGLQTDYIDLTFSGDMMRSLKAGPIGPKSYGIGFLSETEDKKAFWNEKRFGLIFDVTAYELKLSLSIINKEATKILSR